MPAGRDLRGLTSLRFVAGVLVLLHHQAGAVGLPFGLGALGNVGFVGVDFFFVLSGFVLTWSHRDGTPAGTFYRRRFARVYPLHLVGWLLAILVTVDAGSNRYPLLAWALALVLLQAWVPSADWAYAGNGVSWSLSCEALFYATFPWLRPRIAALSPARLRRLGFGVFAALAVVVAVFRLWNPAADTANPGVLYTQPVFRLGEFVIGIVLARLMMSGWRPRLSAAPALAVAGVGYLLIAALFSRLTSGYDVVRLANGAAVREIGGVLILPLVVLVLAAVVGSELTGRLPRVLGTDVAVRLGKWSFAFYVVHQLIVNVLADRLPADGSVDLTADLVVVFAASLAAAAALHHGVEVPMARRLRGGPPPAVVV